MIRRTTFLIFLGYLTLLDGHVAYAEDRDSEAEAVAWLGRMGEALRERNYQGIFSYIRGSIFDTVRIVHRVSEDGETERLFNLNGDIRELYRHDDEI
ncbi:MAG: hypothetical protein O3B72_09530, partial [Proteobacteria bacterium]|nr:hypothetical protein [Pseudomonadota bacterium]